MQEQAQTDLHISTQPEITQTGIGPEGQAPTANEPVGFSTEELMSDGFTEEQALAHPAHHFNRYQQKLEDQPSAAALREGARLGALVVREGKPLTYAEGRALRGPSIHLGKNS